MRRPGILVTLGLLLFACGCGGSKTHTAASHQPTTTTPSQPTTPAVLEQAVRSAIRMNAQLSSYVLWRNTVPSWALRSTNGPALNALKGAAAERAAQHLQLRTASQRISIISIALAPSYLSATAKVRESGSVVQYRRGRRLSQPLRLDEVAQVELRRPDSSPSFRVWTVRASK